MTERVPDPPADLAPRGRGRRFWRAVLAGHELRPDELELLAEAARMLDLCDVLRARADADGPLVTSPQGPRMHPCLVELRQVRESLRKTVAALCIPDPPGDDEEPSPEVADYRTWRARKAARARWDRGA